MSDGELECTPQADAEFVRLYRAAGGTHDDSVAAVREVFATFEQARVFAAEIHSTFAAERERSNELAQALDELRESHRALQASEERFRSLVAHSSDAVLMVDDAGIVQYASTSTVGVWGREASSMAGRALVEFVTASDQEAFLRALHSALQPGNPRQVVTVSATAADGVVRHIEVVLSEPVQDGILDGVVVNTRDVTERHELEERIRYQAFHDTLTGLPNRAALLAQLESATVRVDAPACLSLVMVDIDRLKVINDALGHGGGDLVLVELAQALREAANPWGYLAARLGAGEFAVLVEGADPTDAEALASGLVERFAESHSLGGGVSVTLSAGIASLDAARDAELDLLAAAELALLQAKRGGRGLSAVFDRHTVEAWADRFRLESELSSAAREGQLRLHFQSIVNSHTGRVSGFEALVRWEHPSRGLLPPNVFIPIAEESGSITELGNWVLRESCAQVRRWGLQHAPTPDAPLYVSVNVSAIELRQANYVERVAAALHEYGVHPDRIQLEITESALAESSSTTLQVLHDLKALGVRLAIDDFGTGYSSLSYIAAMPVDVLKVDRSFVVGMLGDSRMRSVVRATLTLASALDLGVIAEGVETREHSQALADLGCTLVQGYLFSRPVPADDVDFGTQLTVVRAA